MSRQPHIRIHFNIQNPGRQPAVDQIVGSIKTQIQTENVASGSRLPPVRVLAHQLGISNMLSFSEFRPSLRARGGNGVFYINSFTKKLLPALRLGYIVGNRETAPALAASKSVSCLGLPTMVEAAVFEFLDRGYYDAHLKQLQHELDRRYQNCLNILRQTMPDSVKWTTPGGGPCVWLEVPQTLCLKTLQDRLAKRNVMIYPSYSSFFGKPHLNGFRIGYAWLPPEEMQQGLEILAETLHKDW